MGAAVPRRDRIAAVIVSIAVPLSALLIGSAPRWAACTTALVCVGAAIPYVTSRRLLARRVPLLILVGAALCATAAQIVPLPAAVVKYVSPLAQATAFDNAAAFKATPPAWLALSRDAAATRVELAILVGYCAFAVACLRLAASHGRRLLLSLVAGTGCALALISLAHAAVGAERVFGLYRTAAATRPPLLAPLVNPNHLAAYMTLSTAAALGVAATAKGIARAVWLGVAVPCAAVGFWTQSRAGAIALVLAVLGFAAMALTQRHRAARGQHRSRSTKVAAALVGCCVGVLMVVFTGQGVISELAATRVAELDSAGGRFAAWRSSATLIEQHPWIGVGRGAFEPAFTAVQPEPNLTFSHVENEYLQIVIDWGIPVAATLMALAAWLAITMARRWRDDPLAAAALAGLVASAVHNVVDFSWELPAVAIATIALIASLTHRPSRTRRAATKPRIAVRAMLLAGGTVIIGLAASPSARSARADETRVVDRAHAATHRDIDADAAWRALTRHPADYALAGHVAAALAGANDDRAFAMVARAIALHPTHSALRLLAARVLARSDGHAQQALVEFAAALTYTRDPAPIVAELVATFPDAERAARGLPTEPTPALAAARRVLALKRYDIAIAHLERVLLRAPRNAPTLQLYAETLVRVGRAEDALAPAHAAYEIAPLAVNALTLSRALRNVGDLSAARSVLHDTVSAYEHSHNRLKMVQMLVQIAELDSIERKYDSARAILDRALAIASMDHDLAATVHRARATVEENAGNRHRAEAERKRAKSLTPSVDETRD